MTRCVTYKVQILFAFAHFFWKFCSHLRGNLIPQMKLTLQPLEAAHLISLLQKTRKNVMNFKDPLRCNKKKQKKKTILSAQISAKNKHTKKSQNRLETRFSLLLLFKIKLVLIAFTTPCTGFVLLVKPLRQGQHTLMKPVPDVLGRLY